MATQAFLPTKGAATGGGTILTIDSVEIGEVVSLPNAGGGETGQIDVTHLRSEAKEYLADLPDNGELTMTVNLVPGDEGQRSVYAARLAQTTHTFTLTFPATPPLILTMQGTVTQFALTASQSEAVRANISVRVSGAIAGFPAPGS